MSSTFAMNRAKSSTASAFSGMPLRVVDEVVAHVVERHLFAPPLLAEHFDAVAHARSSRRYRSLTGFPLGLPRNVGVE